MLLTVENVGKVRKANIEVNGITVITGYNGTGKSTVCKSLYRMLDSYSKLNQKIVTEHNNGMKMTASRWYEKYSKNPKANPWEDYEFAESLIEKITRFGIEKLSLVEFINFVREADNNLGLEQCTEKDVEILFGDIQEIERTDRTKYADFVLYRDFDETFGSQINSVKNQSMSRIALETSSEISNFVEFKDNKLSNCSYISLDMKRPIYIDADNFLSEQDGKRFRKRISERNGRLGRYIEPREMSELTLEEYTRLAQNKEIADYIMKEVTHGELVNDESNKLVFHEDEYEINCKNIASGLKLFLLIQKMLENGKLSQGSILIIDEPEVNLHPEWQIRMAETLVRVNKLLDINIVLCTHSPYFMRAIEVNMAREERADKANYYFMQDTPEGCISENVTGKTEIVYKTMYKPFDEL